MGELSLTDSECKKLIGYGLSSQNLRYAAMERVLPSFEKIKASRVPYRRNLSHQSGIYFLFTRWALLYVGKAAIISARLYTHYMNRVDNKGRVIWFDKVALLEMPQSINAEVELYYIQKLQPRFNVKYSL